MVCFASCRRPRTGCHLGSHHGGRLLHGLCLQTLLTEMPVRTSGAMALFVVFAIAFQEDIRRAGPPTGRYWRPFQSLDQFVHCNDIDPLTEVAFQSGRNNRLAPAGPCFTGVRRFGRLLERRKSSFRTRQRHIAAQHLRPAFAGARWGDCDPARPDRGRMCAHLPLSQNLREVISRGTRHSAGLGLTELTDALVLIVSEESAIVSIRRRRQTRREIIGRRIEVPTGTLLGGEGAGRESIKAGEKPRSSSRLEGRIAGDRRARMVPIRQARRYGRTDVRRPDRVPQHSHRALLGWTSSCQARLDPCWL